MKFGVISDTHGRIDYAIRAIKKMGPVEGVFHAGDTYADGQKIKEILNIPMWSVRGNVDIHADGPAFLCVEKGGKRIFLTHGHKYGIKLDPMRLVYAGLEKRAHIVIYGHTHVASIEKVKGMVLFNPGSVYKERSGYEKSYGILEITNGKSICTLHKL